MSFPLVVVCDNPTCGHVFTANSPIDIAVGLSPSFIGNKLGPCLQCGGMGSIPSGVYTNTGNSIEIAPFTTQDKLLLQHAFDLIQSAMKSNIQPAAFREVAKSKIPQLSSLWDIIPEQKDQRYQFWLVVLGVILAIQNAIPKTSDGPISLRFPPEIVNAIENAQHSVPVDSHNSPPSP